MWAIVVSSSMSSAPDTSRWRRARVRATYCRRRASSDSAVRSVSATSANPSAGRMAPVTGSAARSATRPAPSTRMSPTARAARSRPVSASTTTSNSSPFAAWMVISTTASLVLLGRRRLTLARGQRRLLGAEADESLQVGAAQRLVVTGQPPQLDDVGVAPVAVGQGQAGQVVVVLGDDQLDQPLQADVSRAGDQPREALGERRRQPLLDDRQPLRAARPARRR